jgi:hypothetical protein
MKVLESLVSDNEVLKADNKELHNLLTESREDLQALQLQVEQNINFPPILGPHYISKLVHSNLRCFN